VRPKKSSEFGNGLRNFPFLDCCQFSRRGTSLSLSENRTTKFNLITEKIALTEFCNQFFSLKDFQYTTDILIVLIYEILIGFDFGSYNNVVNERVCYVSNRFQAIFDHGLELLTNIF
jgi:hypothetical protein